MLISFHILQEDHLVTQIFFPLTFSCLQACDFMTFYRCFQTLIMSALCHWYTPAIELKLAERWRRHFSLEWLRNSLVPTSNQPLESAISSFPMSLAFVSPLPSHCHCSGSRLDHFLPGLLLQQSPPALPTSGFYLCIHPGYHHLSHLPTVFITPLLRSLQWLPTA